MRSSMVSDKHINPRHDAAPLDQKCLVESNEIGAVDAQIPFCPRIEIVETCGGDPFIVACEPCCPLPIHLQYSPSPADEGA